MKAGELLNTKYPSGHRVYVSHIQLAGATFLEGEIKRLLKFKVIRLVIEEEAGNLRKPTALKVVAYGKKWFREKSFEVGYLPTEVAVRIQRKGVLDALFVRLRKIEVDRLTRVVVDLTGPGEGKADFLS